jgi:hypothetical protein
MPRIDRLRTVFVETMPETLENGIIYVSQECRVALHNCCCGCGEEVSTPLGPTEYFLCLDGDKVTLRPSIGNHDYPCGSHYLIERGSILWAGAMSRGAIEEGRAFDRYLKRGRSKRGFGASIAAWLRALLEYFRG